MPPGNGRGFGHQAKPFSPELVGIWVCWMGRFQHGRKPKWTPVKWEKHLLHFQGSRVHLKLFDFLKKKCFWIYFRGWYFFIGISFERFQCSKSRKNNNPHFMVEKFHPKTPRSQRKAHEVPKGQGGWCLIIANCEGSLLPHSLSR